MTLLHQRHPELARTHGGLGPGALGFGLGFGALGQRPTPVARLELPGFGAEVWVKDESGFGDGAWGGNKVRKLPDAADRDLSAGDHGHADEKVARQRTRTPLLLEE